MWGAVAVIIAPVLQRIVRDLERQSRRARVSNERVEKLFDDAPHGVALLDPSGSIIRVNISMAVLVGLDPPDMVGHRLADFETPGETRIEDHLGRLMLYRGESLQSECNFRDSGGNDVSVSLSSTVVGDAQMGEIVMVNVVDISDRRRYLDRLAHLADHDVLTGLANRRRFESELDRHLDRCRRHGPTGALLLLDLDNFKQVNDTLGHNAGDQLLVTIAGAAPSVGPRAPTSSPGSAATSSRSCSPTATSADAARVAGARRRADRDHAATLDGVAPARDGQRRRGDLPGRRRARRRRPRPRRHDDVRRQGGRPQPGGRARPRATSAAPAPPPGCTGRAASRRRSPRTASSCTCSRSWTSPAAGSARPRCCCGCATRASWSLPSRFIYIAERSA